MDSPSIGGRLEFCFMKCFLVSRPSKLTTKMISSRLFYTMKYYFRFGSRPRP